VKNGGEKTTICHILRAFCWFFTVLVVKLLEHVDCYRYFKFFFWDVVFLYFKIIGYLSCGYRMEKIQIKLLFIVTNSAHYIYVQ
jgi:hypothetical protein